MDTDFLETHFEISSYLSREMDNSGSIANEIFEEQGIGGIWELAQSLTEKFQELYEDRDWEGEYFETLDKFLRESLKYNPQEKVNQ